MVRSYRGDSTERFTIKVINDIQQSEWPSVDQLIMHKIKRPDFVNPFGHPQCLGLFSAKPFFRLDAQVQL